MRTFLAAAALAAILVTHAAADVIDSGVFTVKITSPREGTVVRSPVAFRVETGGGYRVDRDKACSPASQCYGQEPENREADAGHCHIYVEPEANPGELVGFNPTCADVMEVTLTTPGRYCAYVDLTHHDHVARFKPGPLTLPPQDKVCFRVAGHRGPRERPAFPDFPELQFPPRPR